MHQAPSVRFSVGRSGWHLGAIVALSMLAGVATCAFAWAQPSTDFREALVCVVAGVGSLLALRNWQQSPAGNLAWDGQSWHWVDAAGSHGCQLSLLMDWQRVMLVRLEVEALGSLWVWLQPMSRLQPDWLPLRRAVIGSLIGGAPHPTNARLDAEELPA